MFLVLSRCVNFIVMVNIVTSAIPKLCSAAIMIYKTNTGKARNALSQHWLIGSKDWDMCTVHRVTHISHFIQTPDTIISLCGERPLCKQQMRGRDLPSKHWLLGNGLASISGICVPQYNSGQSRKNTMYLWITYQLMTYW